MTGAPARLAPDAVMARLRAPSRGEWAFIDLREPGEAAEGHAFGSVNLPYSRLEPDIAAKVPRHGTDIVLIDGDDGVAERAGAILARAGYTTLSIVAGGIPAWSAAGLPLFKGVHTFSKAFGEWAQHHFGTPEIGPQELHALLQGPDAPLLIDGRPLAEHRVFTLPGALSCPNAELALRLPPGLPPDRPVVVHCAGRTRSIIGAQTLRDFGLPNPVFALRDGTQGWQLAGYARETGADRPVSPSLSQTALQSRAAEARAVMAREGLAALPPATLAGWLRDGRHTVYCFDPRPEGEGDTPPGFIRTPGTTLVQQTDQFVAVKGARVVLYDPLLVRAVFAALWLARMGIAAHVLEAPPVAALPSGPTLPVPPVPQIGTEHLASLQGGTALLIDLRSSAAFAAARLAGAQWCPRAHLDRIPLPEGAAVVLLAADRASAARAAVDRAARGRAALGANCQSPAEWQAAGLALHHGGAPLAPDARIDDVRFCAGRHTGNLDDARAYLAWETGLLARLDAAGLTPWPSHPHTEVYRSGASTWP